MSKRTEPVFKIGDVVQFKNKQIKDHATVIKLLEVKPLDSDYDLYLNKYLVIFEDRMKMIIYEAEVELANKPEETVAVQEPLTTP